MIETIPLVATVAILLASLLRAWSVAGITGDQPWAFISARGRQRVTGALFAFAFGVLAAAAIMASGHAPTRFMGSGALFAIAGATLVIVAQVQMGRAWRVGVRMGDAPLFVRHGLFRFSRNPIFLGMILIGLGVALSAALWWGWAALFLFIAACHQQVRIEEAHLRANFGIAYDDFSRSVPRWIGLPS